MDKAKPVVIKTTVVTVAEPSDRMLRIAEDVKVGYYTRIDENRVKHVYYISKNNMDKCVIAYIAPFHRIKHTAVIGMVKIVFPFDIEPETCVVNYDGVFKAVIGYRFDKLIFDFNFKGYYLAWQEDSKVDANIGVFIDKIKRGSKLRILVKRGTYPKQTILFHGNRLMIYAITGIFYIHHGEFDVIHAGKIATHYLMRCDFMRKPTPDEIPYAFDYQKIHTIDDRRVIVYTVIPIADDTKVLGIADMFPTPPKMIKRGNAKRNK